MAGEQKKYELLAKLGHGGMADIFLATVHGTKQYRKLAVVKRLREHLAEDPDSLRLFLQEARICARLNHPNVVNTFEVGFDGKHHFIAMEFIEGHSYSAFISRVGRANLPLAVHLRVLIDCLEGIRHAHELKDFDGTPLKLIHRDVSPQNVFIGFEGQVKLLDFGIAKSRESTVSTEAGVVRGKLSYMAPEHALANPMDHRADLFAVGIMLWEAVARKRMWKGKSSRIIMKSLGTPGEIPLPDVSQAPRATAIVLRRALAWHPDQRFAHAGEFRAALEGLLRETGRNGDPARSRRIDESAISRRPD